MKNTISRKNTQNKVSKVKTIRQIISVLVSGGIIATNSIFLKEIKQLKNYRKPEKIELTKLAETKIKNQEYKTANEILDLIKNDPSYNQRKVNTLAKQVKTERESLEYKAKSFWEGFIGKSNGETISTAGEFTADFTFVGDIKDLYRQYHIYKNGKNVDTFIVGLSALGVIATISTITSIGTTLPGKIGVSILKKAKKANKLPKWLEQEIAISGKSMIKKFSQIHSLTDLKKLKETDIINYPHIKKIFESFQEIYKNTGNYDTTLELISKTKKADDLQTMIRLSKTFGKETDIFLKLGGESFLRVYKKYGNTISIETYKKAFKTKGGFKSLEKMGEKRFLKNFHKPTTRILKEIEKIFGKISNYILAEIISFFTLLGASGVFIANLIKLLRRRK